MDKNLSGTRSFWLTLLFFNFIVNLTMQRLSYLRLRELHADLMHSMWSGILVLCLLISLTSIWFMIRVTKEAALVARLEAFHLDGLIWHTAGAILFVAILFLIPYVKFVLEIGRQIKNPVYDPILMELAYYWVCWWMILLAMAALKTAFKTTWLGGFASALVLLGVVYEIMTRFNVVTDFPLSLGWSEGSRYYYASLIFSKRIYGEQFPLSTLHPSRYLLQSIPFLFPGLDLFAHRFWQFLLWIGLTAGASLALTHRVFTRQEYYVRWLAAGWLFLYLLQVGVYYHLEVMVIIPLLFVSGKHPWRSLLAVIIASAWAGISRVNWFPMPVMIAIAVYLLETPFHSSKGETGSSFYKQLLGYIAQPALWTVAGLASALLSQLAYVYVSGNYQNSGAFTSSFKSDLLWYRLLPNDNYPLGILPAILIVSGPLIITLIIAARHAKALHTVRWLGLTGMLIALFIGSAVVSTKIGGGGDLHNMDAFAVLVAVVGLYFFGGRVQAEQGFEVLNIRPTPVSALALITPLLFLIPALSPYPKYNEGRAQAAYQQLLQVVNDAGKKGPVLFMNDRELVALGAVKVPLVYDYEVVTLMEMAMSRNQVYLDKFYNELADHRFSAIVATKQNIAIKQEG
ncbi:MAG TPA: hypothetical protein VN653_04510, partial [Anaerolineales bacterium]|nr:hypothetical protein [Anaerolineales bacterium]